MTSSRQLNLRIDNHESSLELHSMVSHMQWTVDDVV